MASRVVGNDELQFRMLGPLEVLTAGGQLVGLSGTRQERILAALLMEPNSVVSIDRLIEILWEDPPATARGQVQMVISTLRRACSAHGRGNLIATRSPGYRLQADASSIDAQVFLESVARGRELVAQEMPMQAVVELRSALDLWRGRMLDGSVCPSLENRAAAFEERRMNTIELVMQLELDLGKHLDVIEELVELAAENPLREGLQAKLMTALFHSGRRAEALAVFLRARTRLVEELGLEPGRELRQAQQVVLAG